MSLRKKNGHNSLRQKTPVIYVLAVIFLTILFFSNDFGLVDIQKTAIVLAVGIERENEEFIVNSLVPETGVSEFNRSGRNGDGEKYV